MHVAFGRPMTAWNILSYHPWCHRHQHRRKQLGGEWKRFCDGSSAVRKSRPSSNRRQLQQSHTWCNRHQTSENVLNNSSNFKLEWALANSWQLSFLVCLSAPWVILVIFNTLLLCSWHSCLALRISSFCIWNTLCEVAMQHWPWRQGLLRLG